MRGRAARRTRHRGAGAFFFLAIVPLATGACGEPAQAIEPVWEVVMSELPSALLSVWGSSAEDIWAVGADAQGLGPTVLHFDGGAWTERRTGMTGDLWWVFGFEGGPTYMGGAGGLILRYEDGTFARMPTPGTGTVFGIWGSARDDLWAVGGAAGGASGAFAWRFDGARWFEAPGFPPHLSEEGAIWKLFGRGSDDVWLVGTNGTTVHWDGAIFTEVDTGVAESLFTVHASSTRVVAVGGFGTGIILENEGSGWVDVSPVAAPALTGVCVVEHGGVAVGADGAVLRRRGDGWRLEDTGLDVLESLHSVWIDGVGDVWAVGGQTSAFPLIEGVLIHGSSGGSHEHE